MRIAVCDDEEAAREAVVTCIENYMIDRNIELEYETFEHYAALEPLTDSFDVFIMDYQMPDVDGLEFARKIREKYTGTKSIIFVTSYSEIVYEAFTVRTHRFIVKPVTQEKLYEALDSAVERSGSDTFLIVKRDGVTSVINTGEIYYIEAQKKECCIFLENDHFSVYKTITSLDEELCGSGFFRAHRAFLINLRKVRRFTSREVILANGESVALSARKYPELCKAYLKTK